MRRNGYKTTSSVKFDSIFELFVPDLLYNEKLGLILRFQVISDNFPLRMRRNVQNSTSGQILNPKFEILMGCFLLNTDFGAASAKTYTCCERKTAFVMKHFRNLGAVGGGGENFLMKPPKGTSLPNFTRFESLIMQIRSRLFSLCEPTKKEHYKKSQRRYISPICGEFPTQQNSTKIAISVGVTDIINHTKFDNDRSRQYKVTEGRISPCSIGARPRERIGQ